MHDCSFKISFRFRDHTVIPHSIVNTALFLESYQKAVLAAIRLWRMEATWLVALSLQTDRPQSRLLREFLCSMWVTFVKRVALATMKERVSSHLFKWKAPIIITTTTLKLEKPSIVDLDFLTMSHVRSNHSLKKICSGYWVLPLGTTYGYYLRVLQGDP